MKEEIKGEGRFKNNNAVKLLRTFSRTEFREFGKFVMSPFHNNRADVTRFFDEIKKYHPSFEQQDFTKEKIFSKLYRGKKFRDDVIRRLSSNLFLLAEEFIAHKKLVSERFDKERYLLEYYSLKNDDTFFKKQLKKIHEYLEKQELRNDEYYYMLNRINGIKGFYVAQEDVTRLRLNSGENLKNIWQYSVIALLRSYGVAITDIKYFNKEYKLGLLEPLLKIYEHPEFMKSKTAEIYFNSLKLSESIYSKKVDDITFFKLKELLDKNPLILPKDESFSLYIDLQNYIFHKNQDPNCDWSKTDFELITAMLNRGLLTEKGTITAEWFVNVFIRAVVGGEILYAEKFIKEYGPMLKEKERDNVLNYAFAELAIAKKEYDMALKHLAITKYNNTWEKLRANFMYIKIYYETKNTESFFYIIDSFRHIIKNESSVSEYVKGLYENLIKYSLKLYRVKTGEIEIPLEQLKKEILESEIMGIKWVYRKLLELEKDS